MTDWETRYYEAEALHTESNGMLTQERNEWMRKCGKARDRVDAVEAELRRYAEYAEQLEAALGASASRWNDLAAITEESGPYTNTGFMRASARRCLNAIKGLNESTGAQGVGDSASADPEVTGSRSEGTKAGTPETKTALRDCPEDDEPDALVENLNDEDDEPTPAMREAMKLHADLLRTQSGTKPVEPGCYVQPVPDHCDRITWRNRYWMLDERQLSAKLVEVPQVGTVPEGFELVPKAALDWLNGESPEGFEPSPGTPIRPDGTPSARYWWRSEFKRRIHEGRSRLVADTKREGG